MRIGAVRRLCSAALAGVFVLAVAGMPTAAHAAQLNGSTERAVRAGTFEVVQLKPPETGVQYDRPPPLELIPFQQRVDKYRSVGTAFAIGHNQYVTASHVLILGQGSQFGPPALRDAAGNVYAIDQVLKYSNRQDFAVFSLVHEPPGVKALQIGSALALNGTVFAVGNALGEGIVVRDGVFTSETPEEMNGDWKWIRFSAAASPGNSGGPLVDERGRVVGVVLRKTEAENLNYALPMQQVVAAPEGVGKLEGRTAMRLPIVLDTAETSEQHEQFKLPLALADFYTTVRDLTNKDLEQAQAHLIADNSARLFPNGNGSEQLLHEAPGSPLPRFIRENQDGVWGVINTNPQNFQLDANGFVRVAGPIVRLHAPDNVPLAQLYGDSKLLMDLILKGNPLRRQVGSEAVRVTSLGAAQEQGSYTDRYGRIWQIRTWALPFDDTVLSALCLPTPEGYDVMLVRVLSGNRPTILHQQELLTDYLYLTFTATLSRWHDYLSLPVARPAVFNGLTIDVQPGQQVHFHSQRFDLTVKPDLVPLSADSVLALDTSFYRDGPKVTWDVSGLTVAQSTQQANRVQVVRVAAPGASLPEGMQANWHKMQSGEYPFNATVFTDNGNSIIRQVAGAADPAAGSKHAAQAPADASSDPPASSGGIEYALTVVDEGSQAQQPMAAKLALLQRSFRPLEH